MATYACVKCGLVGDAEPCVSCGAPAFDLASPVEIAALRFTMRRRTYLRAGVGAGIGFVIGFVHALWLRADTLDIHSEVMIAWPLAFAALATLVRRREIAALEAELAARTGRTSLSHRASVSTLAIGLLVIVVETATVVHHQATTMLRRDAQHLVVKRTCELAERCTTGVLCMVPELMVDLDNKRSRVDRSDIDDCLDALDALERSHATCDAPAPSACTAISPITIPALLGEAHALHRQLDRELEDQVRQGLARRRRAQ